jgi:hypothetical protein
MRRLLPALLAAVFAAVTFSAYAADPATPDTQSQPPKPAKKKKKSKPPAVQQSAPADQSGRGAPQSSGTGGVTAGGNAAGRGNPTGTAAPGGGVTSPTPTGAGRSDNQ